MPTLTRSHTVTPATRETQGPATSHVLLRVLGAALALGIAYIHVRDQGGFPGDKSPAYIGLGYYLLEAAGFGTAIALLVASKKQLFNVWTLAFGIALGPLAGFVLSRGPGLPMYTDDRGNWTEPLAIISVVVEGALLVLASVVLGRSRRSAD